MATNKEVAEAFVKGNPAHSEHMWSTGVRLLSYSLQIAHRDTFGTNEIVLDYSERKGHTHTTQRHMRELEAAMRDG